MLEMDKAFLLLLLWVFRAGQTESTSGTNQRNSLSFTEDQPSLYFFYQQSEYPRDCVEALLVQCTSANSTGVYTIKPDGYPEVFDVYCDSDGYTVIERRLDGLVSFNRSWEDYTSGFGFLSQEFWLGTHKLSYITNQKTYLLRIEFTLYGGSTIYATYGAFRIADAYSDYTLISTGSFSDDGGSNLWGPCSVTCGEGVSRRYNRCTEVAACVERNIEESVCNEGECPIAGVWSSWTAWTRCSVTCQQIRERMCNNPAPQHGGQNCVRNARQNQRCYTDPCIVSDCQDIYDGGQTSSGLYYISPSWSSPFQVYCNMSHGGGWTVIQRRIQSSSRQRFNLNWAQYKNGFGTPSGEFWFGNERLYQFSNQKRYELRIDMVNEDHDSYYAKYNFFRITSESNKYRLAHLETFSGTAEHDAMGYDRGQFFSTPDRDNDRYSGYHCGVRHSGGWWYENCHISGGYYGDYRGDLNRDESTRYVGYWIFLPGRDTLIYTEMKLRPRG